VKFLSGGLKKNRKVGLEGGVSAPNGIHQQALTGRHEHVVTAPAGLIASIMGSGTDRKHQSLGP